MADTAFDVKEYMRKGNEREHPVTGEKKPAETATTETAASTTTTTDDDAGEPAHLSRSARRTLRRLGEAEGRAAAYKEILEKGVKVPDTAAPASTAKTGEAVSEDPEPKREGFKDDAEYNRALGKWEARQEAKKVVTADTQNKEQIEALRKQLADADKKAGDDKKLFDDWDAVMKEAEQDGPEIDWSANPQLTYMFGVSDQQAGIAYYWAKHPDEFEKLVALTKTNPQEQIRLFHRLEGKVEELYEKSAVGETKPEKTAAQRDAAKARPSDSASARGGSAPDSNVKPYLEDGKTVNPAWLEKANQRERR